MQEVRLKLVFLPKKYGLCGTENASNYEIHHVYKIKDLKGKAKWEQMMIAKQRKTMVLCEECHKKYIKKEFQIDKVMMASCIH